MKKIPLTACSALALSLLGGNAYCQSLAAHIDASQIGNNWSYTLTNNEAASSPYFLSDFNLSVGAPFEDVTAPVGWSYTTDNSSYIYWFNTDAQLPYPHDVAPGAHLDGFSFTSSVAGSQLSSYGLSSWDHSQDAPGTTAVGMILTPRSPAAVPEASTAVGLGMGLILVATRRRVLPKKSLEEDENGK